MKTIEKKYYVCEICGRTSMDETKIQECQSRHRCIDDTCEIEYDFTRGGSYPKAITVRWPDGASAVYALAGCKDPAPAEHEKD